MVASLISIRIAAGQSATDTGLRLLNATVQRSCACAGQKSTGVQAALACTQELNTFASLKLEYSRQWTASQQQLAGQIEMIIETCLSEALDYRETLATLGIEAPIKPLPQSVTSHYSPYTWQEIQTRKLNLYTSRLIRIEDSTGDSVKGLVEHLDAQTLHLLRARIDGGGLMKYNLKDLRSVWVLLPSPDDSGGS